MERGSGGRRKGGKLMHTEELIRNNSIHTLIICKAVLIRLIVQDTGDGST